MNLRLRAFGLVLVYLPILQFVNGRVAWADAPEIANSTLALVQQLGDDDFQTRLAAEQELLQLALPARPALLQGLKSEDPHIRRTSRRLLDRIVDVDLQNRIDAFVKGDSADELALPGWNRYREIAGDDENSRALFVDMLRAEPGLLESFASGPHAAANAIRLRTRQVRAAIYSRNTAKRQPPSLATMSAMVLVASDPACRPPTGELQLVLSMFQRKEIAEPLSKGAKSEPARRLLGEIILSCNESALSRQCLQLAMTLKMKEPGLRLALRMVTDAKQQQPVYIGGAIGVLAILGDRDYAKAIIPLLDDERQCSLRIVKGKRVSIQVRDVATAWLVKISGQKLADYGLESAANWFKSIDRYPASCFSVSNLMFEDEDKRKTAIEKLRRWLDGQKLASIELEPAPLAKKATPAAALKTEADDVADEDQSEYPKLALAEYDDIRLLQVARRRVAEKQYMEATALLGLALEKTGDLVYRPKGEFESFRSLRTEAESLLAGLNRQALEAYELQYGSVANERLTKAVAAGDLAELAAVNRHYFLTKAGSQAAYLLGVAYRAQGQPWLASIYFQRLETHPALDERIRQMLPLELAMCWLLADRPDAVRMALRRWKESWDDATVELGGSPTQPFADDEDPYLWLRNRTRVDGTESDMRLVPRGDFTGSENFSGGSPWPEASILMPLASDRIVKGVLGEIENDRRKQRRGVIPTLHAVAIGDVIIQRTIAGLSAMRRDDGGLLWHIHADHALNQLLQNERKISGDLRQFVRQGIERRIWDDPSWGELSSNGQLVFAIEDLGFDLGLGYQRIVTRMDGSRQLDSSPYRRSNVLAAYDVRSGKLIWQIGSVFEQSDGIEQLTDGRFLGPPLPLGSRLYAVVDYDQDSRLLVIDAETGKVSQQLVLDFRDQTASRTTTSITQVPAPQTPPRCAAPVFAEGLLVCNLPDGRFIAVDIVGGDLVWTYAHPPAAGNDANARLKNAANQKTAAGHTDRWWANSATLADSSALLCVDKSNELVCLDLQTGNPRWAVPRDDGLYVGAIDNDVVIVVGRSGIRGIRLDDGQPIWSGRKLAFSGGAVPAGHGFLSDGEYFVPLTTGGIAAFDIRAGRPKAIIRGTQNMSLGNLLPVGQHMISVGPSGIARLDRFSVRRDAALAAFSARPEEPHVIADRARIALAEEDVEFAVDLLSKAVETHPDAVLTQLLVQSLLQGMRRDPAKFAARLDSVEVRLPQGDEGIDDWLSFAETLQKNGLPKRAIAIYQRLLDKPEPLRQLEPVEAALSVRRDHRLLNAVQRLRSSPHSTSEILAMTDDVLEKAMLTAGNERLRYRIARAANNDLWAEQRIAEEEWIEAELLYQRLFHHADDEQRIAIGQRLAALMKNAGNQLDAANLLKKLGRHSDSSAGLIPWSATDIRVTKNSVGTRSDTDPLRSSQFLPLGIDKHDRRLSIDLYVNYEPRQRLLTAVDRWGRQRIKMTLPTSTMPGNSYVNSSMAYFHGLTIGHLLVIYRGDMVAAIDTLAKEPKLLWHATTLPANIKDSNAARVAFMRVRAAQRRNRAAQAGSQSRSLAATEEWVCFQRDRDLCMVDPLTGDVLWARDDLPDGCDLTGRDDRIFATLADGSATVVFDAFTGQKLQRLPGLDISDRLAIIDGYPLMVDDTNKPKTLGLYDVVQQQYVWTRALKSGEIVAPIGGQAVGLLVPSGDATVITADTGDEQFQVNVGPLDGLEDATWLPFDGIFVLAAHLKDTAGKPLINISRALAGGKLIDGKLFGLQAATGKIAWSQTIENQQIRLEQPSGLPLLVACNRYQKPIKSKNNSFRFEAAKQLIKCIDTRDGSILHDTTAKTTYYPNYIIHAEIPKNTAKIEFVDQSVDFKFEEK